MSNSKVFVLMGVSGCGKSVVASRLAQELNAVYLDGDFLHPRTNIKKMASGEPLNDADRAPWLLALNDAVYAMQRSNPVSFIVCSALKKKYRDVLRTENSNLSFIFLQGDYDLIEKRIGARSGHFQRSNMLQSQFAALELPDSSETDVITIDVTPSLDEVVAISREAILNQE